MGQTIDFKYGDGPGMVHECTRCFLKLNCPGGGAVERLRGGGGEGGGGRGGSHHGFQVWG